MSQTKQECMEYILVLLDDMKSEVRKIMHKDNYQTYDGQMPDLDYLHEALGTISDELETLEDMFESCIPEETRAMKILELENEVLRKSLIDLKEKLNAKNSG